MKPVAGCGAGTVERSVDELDGVSQERVSRVMNDEPYVFEDVRCRVLAAPEELGYCSDDATRTPVSGRTVHWHREARCGPERFVLAAQRH